MILLYCKKCNNLIEKVDGVSLDEGEIMVRICPKCDTEQEFFIKYKAVSTIIDRFGGKDYN